MRRSPVFLVTVVLLLTASSAWAVDPLAGTWLLKHQEVAGNQTDSNPLMLAIAPSGNRLDFAFIVTVNNEPVVNLKFSSPLDGTPAEVTAADGTAMATATAS